jgi:hypothetical protein
MKKKEASRSPAGVLEAARLLRELRSLADFPAKSYIPSITFTN